MVDARCAGRCSWHDGRRTTSRRVGPPPEGRRSSGGQASLTQVRRPLSPRRIRRVDSAVGAEQIRVSDAPSVKRLARKKPPPKNGNSKLWANEVATRLRACESPPATHPQAPVDSSSNPWSAAARCPQPCRRAAAMGRSSQHQHRRWESQLLVISVTRQGIRGMSDVGQLARPTLRRRRPP